MRIAPSRSMRRLFLALSLFGAFAVAIAPATAGAKWAKNGKPMKPEHLERSITAAVRKAYKLQRRTADGKPAPIAYKGVAPASSYAKVVLGSPQQMLDNNSDRPLQAIAKIALLLGAEQGRRAMLSDPSFKAAMRLVEGSIARGDVESAAIAFDLLKQLLTES